MGAGGLRLFRRAPQRPTAVLDFARGRSGAGVVGKIFYGDTGGAACAVLAVRPGRPAAPGRTWPLDCRRRHPHCRGAKSSLDLFARRPALSDTRDAGARRRAWLDLLTSCGFLGAQAVFVIPALLIAAPLFWPRVKLHPGRARTLSIAASFRCLPSGRRSRFLFSRSLPGARPRRCGAFRCGCS